MLRWIMGDEAFFRGTSFFLKKHEFSNVESADLKIALEEATGSNLDWFFEQWVYGGGHPVLEVEAAYLPHLKKAKVTINQVQPVVAGQGLFTLPVEIRLDVAGTTTRTRVWINNEQEEFLLEAAQAPDLVSVDGIGRLVCELRHGKTARELAYQALHDDLSGRLWAVGQIVRHHAADPQTLGTLKEIVTGKTHWSIKAEATTLLRHIESKAAEDLLLSQLKSSDYHIRKAAVIALGSRFSSSARSALRSLIDREPVDDVAATAIVALARIDGSLSAKYLEDLAAKGGWYDVRRIAALEAAQILGDVKFLPLVKESASKNFNYQVRLESLGAWAACAPADPELVTALTEAAVSEILPVRLEALTLLGDLKIEQSLSALEGLAAHDGDSDIREAARNAIDKILRGEVR